MSQAAVSAPTPDAAVGEVERAYSLDRIWGEFRDRGTESAYRRHVAVQELFALRVLLAIGAVSGLLQLCRDMAGFDSAGRALPSLFTSLAWVVGVAGPLWYLRARSGSPTAPRRAGLAFSVLVLTAIVARAWLVPSAAPSIVAGFSMLLLAIHAFAPSRLPHVTAVAVAASLAMIAASRLAPGFAEPSRLAPDLLMANVLGQALAHCLARRHRREFAALMRERYLAVRDHLTGCLNRRSLFDVLLPAELARARRLRRSLSLILCDIDHFKAINDNHGHQAGDALIRRFASVLQDGSRRGSDSVIRYGGEEFLVLLPDTDVARAVDMAERMRRAFAGLAMEGPGGARITATASFGVSGADFVTDPGHVSAHELIAAADRLLYEAKRASRNNVRFDGPDGRMRQAPRADGEAGPDTWRARISAGMVSATGTTGLFRIGASGVFPVQPGGGTDAGETDGA